jgi:small subunit ribosomal protein S5
MDTDKKNNTSPAGSHRPSGRGRPHTGSGEQGGARRDRQGGGRRREERARAEFDHKVVEIRRVTRVVAGGRRFSFSVSLIAGDKRGKVGVGLGKAGDTALAIEKAMRDAKKHMVHLPLTEGMSIPHDVSAKYAASDIEIRPAPGRGVVAGSSVRTVLEYAGVKDVTAKVFSRSKNKLNNARAAVKALRLLKS